MSLVQDPPSFSPTFCFRALGCVVYELCALRPPFRGDNFEELSKRVRAGYYPNIPRVYSNEMMGMIKSLLATKATERPSAKLLLENPSLSKRIQTLNQSTQHIQQDDVNLLQTIKVPEKLSKLTQNLPKACYPDKRPNSPNSWPITKRHLSTSAGGDGGAKVPQGFALPRQQPPQSIVAEARNALEQHRQSPHENKAQNNVGQPRRPLDTLQPLVDSCGRPLPPKIDTSHQYESARVVTDPSTPLRKAQRPLMPAKQFRESWQPSSNLLPPAQQQVAQYGYKPGNYVGGHPKQPSRHMALPSHRSGMATPNWWG
jgi:hypothetical protein